MMGLCSPWSSMAPGLEGSNGRAQREGSILVSALIPALFQEVRPAELGLN